MTDHSSLNGEREAIERHERAKWIAQALRDAAELKSLALSAQNGNGYSCLRDMQADMVAILAEIVADLAQAALQQGERS